MMQLKIIGCAKTREKKQTSEISLAVRNCSMTRHVRNVGNVEHLGIVRKVSNERLKQQRNKQTEKNHREEEILLHLCMCLSN